MTAAEPIPSPSSDVHLWRVESPRIHALLKILADLTPQAHARILEAAIREQKPKDETP